MVQLHGLWYKMALTYAISWPKNKSRTPQKNDVTRYIQTTFICKKYNIYKGTNTNTSKTKKCFPWALGKTDIQRLGRNNPYSCSLGSMGLGIQQGTSVWVGSPKSNRKTCIYRTTYTQHCCEDPKKYTYILMRWFLYLISIAWQFWLIVIRTHYSFNSLHHSKVATST